MKEYLPNEECKSCGGCCCKAYPGGYLPQDFGITLLNARDKLPEIIADKFIAVDWWECVDWGNCYIRDGYFLRPKVIHSSRKFDPTWGGPCVHLSENGCILPREKRPKSCKTAKPREANGEPCTNTIRKRHLAQYWWPYRHIIDEIKHRYEP